jgi:putative pyruvate formate lyase activating enzyme
MCESVDFTSLLNNVATGTGFVCNLCPHKCNVDRSRNKTGYCKTDQQIHVSSIVLHKGEEPVISGEKGICNLFFTHCNLQCIYCQNYQISNNKLQDINWVSDLDSVVRTIGELLPQSSGLLGFVSPSHQIFQMLLIIQELKHRKFFPGIVYNSNGYDNVDVLRLFDDVVNIYLPDFKYADKSLGEKLSGVKDYPEIALKAIKEMIRQKGTSLRKDENGIAESGVIIRHLVLPGFIQNSKNALLMLADELGTNIHISLMAQYNPISNIISEKVLTRNLSVEEYQEVVNYMDYLGFYKGWVQELSSSYHYNPDFEKENPFE